MLKVCYIITKLELGGAQKLALYTAEHLDKTKFGNFIITGKGGILDKEASEKFRLLQLDSFVREVSPVKDLKALFQIYKILKREKPDVVHTHSSKAGILGRIAAKLAGIKTIIHTIHGYGFNETQKWYVKYVYVYIEKFCNLITDKLIAVSKEDIKKGLRYKLAKEIKFILIRAGIDTEFYKNYTPDVNFRESMIRHCGQRVAQARHCGLDPQSQKSFIVSTIGPFKPQKNLKDFIKAAGMVADKIDNVFFLIAGDGEQRPELESLIASLNLKDKVILLGWRKDIADILYASDIFVMTSLWEGLPCTILEAMCCSKPVIANAVDGVQEIIEEGKTGFKVKPYDFPYTAEKIIYLLKNERIMLEMGKSAKESIGKEFDINYAVKQQEDLYIALSK
ncbi:MAG: glycosyltransferase family 4 protein [Endomicrobia bacterium]|nr:glycosyltransferase family 4 protein [Endomicrobiia bacterium]MCL2506728.1 glycosyltransferase family 4 protein [Endomicrobiia bacterium]